jgi:hypothetical protein
MFYEAKDNFTKSFLSYWEVVSMCGECTFIEEEDVPMIFESEKSDTPEKYPNLLNQSCCGGSCQCGK